MPIMVGDLCIRPEQRRVEWAGSAVELTSTEFNLLEVLARNAGKPVTKNELSEQALGRPLPRTVASLALNSPHGRSQHQLHIHIDCLRADVLQALDTHAPAVGMQWAALPVPAVRFMCRHKR